MVAKSTLTLSHDQLMRIVTHSAQRLKHSEIQWGDAISMANQAVADALRNYDASRSPDIIAYLLRFAGLRVLGMARDWRRARTIRKEIALGEYEPPARRVDIDGDIDVREFLSQLDTTDRTILDIKLSGQSYQVARMNLCMSRREMDRRLEEIGEKAKVFFGEAVARKYADMRRAKR